MTKGGTQQTLIHTGISKEDIYLPLREQKAHVERVLSRLAKLREMPCGTAAAMGMWQEKIDDQLEFYCRLAHQVETSRFPGEREPG